MSPTARIDWHADHEQTKRDVLHGRAGEYAVALELLSRGGIAVELEPLSILDDAVNYAGQIDLVANGVRIEVKNMRTRFTSHDTYPHRFIFVGSVPKWQKRIAAGTYARAVVIRSAPTGALLAIMRPWLSWQVCDWGIEKNTSSRDPSYGVPADKAIAFDELADMLAHAAGLLT